MEANKKEKSPKKEKNKDLKQASNSGKYSSPFGKEKVKQIKVDLKELGNIPIMTDEPLKRYLTAVVLGLVPDRFGMEVSAETKVKAAGFLNKLNESDTKANQEKSVDEEINTASDFILKVRGEETNEGC